MIILAMFAFYLKDNPEISKRIYSIEMIQVKVSGPGKWLTGIDTVEKANGFGSNSSFTYKMSRRDQLLADGQAVDLGKR